MAPLTDFEAKVKELVGLIDQPIAAIDGQLKAYEEQRRAAKRADIMAIYEETVGELRALLPFGKLGRTVVQHRRLHEENPGVHRCGGGQGCRRPGGTVHGGE